VKNTQDTSRAKSILCVDDDADTCELLEFLFSEYEFKSAHNLEEGFRLIESRRFDLYIFDNWLPDGSGVELCRKVRELGHESPILFVSGVAQREDIQEALRHGADQYLIKPCEPYLLNDVVKELI
jgi:DNA-binding response OmpR family regulator